MAATVLAAASVANAGRDAERPLSRCHSPATTPGRGVGQSRHPESRSPWGHEVDGPAGTQPEEGTFGGAAEQRARHDDEQHQIGTDGSESRKNCGGQDHGEHDQCGPQQREQADPHPHLADPVAGALGTDLRVDRTTATTSSVAASTTG